MPSTILTEFLHETVTESLPSHDYRPLLYAVKTHVLIEGPGGDADFRIEPVNTAQATQLQYVTHQRSADALTLIFMVTKEMIYQSITLQVGVTNHHTVNLSQEG